MAYTTEMESLFKKMGDGTMQENDILVTPRGRILYKVKDSMVGGGAMTVSPVEQSIQQAKQMNRLKRARSRTSSHSRRRPAKRRKRTTSKKRRKRSTRKRSSKPRKKGRKRKGVNKKRKGGGRRKKTRKRRSRDALD